jgi:hypothetical protein
MDVGTAAGRDGTETPSLEIASAIAIAPIAQTIIGAGGTLPIAETLTRIGDIGVTGADTKPKPS